MNGMKADSGASCSTENRIAENLGAEEFGAEGQASLGAAQSIGWWWLETDVPEPGQPALLDGDGDVVTRGDLAAAVRAAALFLARHGIERGDRLALALSPGPSQVAGLLAGMAVAAVAPLAQTSPAGHVRENLRRLRVTRVIVDDDASAAVGEAARSLGLPVLALSPFRLPPVPPGNLTPQPDPEDLALLMQSSGTTARPKLVPLDHANLLAGARAISEVVALTPEDRTLAAMPLFHIHGIVATLLAPLLTGGSVICCRDRAADRLLAQLTSLRPTWVSASPPLLLALCDAVERAGAGPLPHHLRFLRSVTMPLAPAARARIEAVFKVPILEVYGMTEASSQVCSSRLPGGGVAPRPGSVGQAAGPSVSVLGPDGQPCPAGVTGEVVIRGESVTRGYEGVDRGGWISDARGEAWLPTGDEGVLDEDGCLTLRGRLKDMINRGGMKVNPLHVDEVLNRHPAVDEALAFGVPHPTLGEELMAAVVLRAGAAADEEQLRAHLIALLPAHEVPASIVFVDLLPRGSTGKPQRHRMAALLADRLDPAAGLPAQGDLEHLVAQTFSQELRRVRTGRDDNFFLLGGDSLSSAGVVLSLERALGLELSPTLPFAHPTVRGLARQLGRLLAEAPGETSRPGSVAPAEPLPAIGLPGLVAFPASFGQTRLWFLHQSEPERSSYHLVALWRLRGQLDREALRQALTALVARHPTLRTSFLLREGSLVQLIHPPVAAPLAWEALGDRHLDEAIETWLQQEESTPFDLTSGLLIRGRLLAITPEDHLLLLNHHHIASDGWSRNVLAEDLTALYNAARAGVPSTLPPLGLQYQDHAVWHRDRLRGHRLQGLLDYWIGELEGLEPIALPADDPVSSAARPGGASVSIRIDPALLVRFEELCRIEGATLHMGMLAAVALLLHRRSQQEDFAIGVPVGGRNQPGMESLIGFFVNTLPIRVRFERGMTFRQLLARVRDTSIGAYEHQDLPFEQIVKAVGRGRDGGLRPLVQVMLQVMGVPIASLGGMDGIEAERLPVRPLGARFDLEFFLRRDGEGGLQGELIHDTERFQTASLERLVAQLRTLLNASIKNPDAPVASLELLPPPELARLESWRNGGRAPVGAGVIDELVEHQAACSPEAIALMCGDERITYAELVDRADRLAHGLVALGVGPDVLVAVCLDRSVEQLVSVLAILKAGGAYLPLEPTLPQARREHLLRDSGAAVVLTDREAAALGATGAVRVVDPKAVDARAPVTVRGRSRPESLAYVLYTSGSTGQPKGVAMPHGALVNLLGWQASSSPGAARTLQFANLGFDVSFQEIFSTWITGGTLVLVPDEVKRDPSALLMVMDQQGIERAFLPVVMLERLAAAAVTSRLFPATLREMFVAGEPLRITADIRHFVSRLNGCRLWNHYGPTETHVVTAFRLPADPAEWPDRPPIGTPISNTTVYVLDREMRQLPQGVPGDVWIGGAAVARGYWQNVALTEERFVPDPWGRSPRARLYRSGDRARWLSNGQLEFLGRIDDQVKIRGHRVELGEIESVLSGHPEIRAVAAIVREAPGLSRSIDAFVVSAAEVAPQPGALRSWMRGRLPEPAVPARITVVPSLPVNVNGKVDRRTLERWAATTDTIDHRQEHGGDRSIAGRTDNRREGPVLRTLLEAEVVKIWQRLFGHDDISPTSDFFDLGGDSLMAAQLVLELERLFAHRVPLALLFSAPTLEQLVQALAAESWIPAWSSLVALQPEGSRLPLFLVHGWGGDVFLFSRFARSLSSDQPVYGLRAKDGDGRSVAPPSVEQMAAHYAEEIAAFQPAGPYQLGGHSVGGMFTYAVATELRKRGAEVRMILFDTYPSGHFPWPAAGAKHLTDALRAVSRALCLAVETSCRLRQRAERGVERSSVLPKGPPRPKASTEPFVRVMARHSSRAIEGQVELFQCPAPFLAPLLARSQALFWRLLVRGPVNLHQLSSLHKEVFLVENLPAVVAKVDAVLAGWNATIPRALLQEQVGDAQGRSGVRDAAAPGRAGPPGAVP